MQNSPIISWRLIIGVNAQESLDLLVTPLLNFLLLPHFSRVQPLSGCVINWLWRWAPKTQKLIYKN